ncbi:MAG: DeoR/GlpR transcriptional regulator [Proteobacteria bacterium]|nr:DeoR/GlpR transcriptional regulator [Pseudomonadota bacterium]
MKRPVKRPMKREERFDRIIASLRNSPAVRISALAESFEVSVETVRRDIDELSRRGLVDRTYGGAALRLMAHEPEVNERRNQLIEERLRIGDYASGLVSSGDVLMIDSGSTTTHFARRLADAATGEITVLTNAPSVAQAAAKNPRLRVILCPGDYDPHEGGVFGPETTHFLQRFNADKTFIGASGLTCAGPVEANSPVSWIKRAMIGQAKRSLLMVDHTKFNADALERVCPLTDIDDVIADTAPDEVLSKALTVAKVSLHIAG